MYSKGCSAPRVPHGLSPAVAKTANFGGLIIHSQEFAQNLDGILEQTANGPKSIVVVGGGKSAQE
jgi:cation diffusion facilitator CzcD-associated flavoprotein CzcO